MPGGACRSIVRNIPDRPQAARHVAMLFANCSVWWASARDPRSPRQDLVTKVVGIEVFRRGWRRSKPIRTRGRQIGLTRRQCLDWILIFDRRYL
jgi:hypothetical protein